MDQMAIALSTMCNLSDRRNDRLLDPSHNGSLPAFLCKENQGLRFGLSGGQFCSTSLTAENRAMATPISIQSLPSTGDFQDHVSFGLVAARRTRDLLKNSSYVVAFELICACQAADIRGTETLSSATKKVHGMVRELVPYLDHDVPLTDPIEAVADLMYSGKLLEALPDDAPAFDW
jgi:histidine ammonia-lyase